MKLNSASIAVCLLIFNVSLRGATELGVKGSEFTINGKPKFLVGISYYGALGGEDEFIRRDLNQIQRDGFNWIRVWANWAAFQNNISAVDTNGASREPYLSKLERLTAACDERGIIVDITLARENGVTGPPRLLTLQDHRRAVETLIERLRPFRNWYLDLGNERNIRDSRFVSIEDLKELRGRARELDPKRLITASHSADDEEIIDQLERYIKFVRVDFISVHRPRHKESPGQTQSAAERCLKRMKEIGTIIPIHFDEPFRRGYTEWEPSAEDFFQDLRGAIKGGAAGWCFHNGSQRKTKDQQPRRSFDLRGKRLYDQLDREELKVAAGVKAILAEEGRN